MSDSDDPGVWWTRTGIALEGDRPEDATRILTPCVVPVAGVGLRLFYMGHGPASPPGTRGRILSARSVDGARWTKEDGVRVECEPGETRTLSPDVVAVDGGFRMYFETVVGTSVIASAFSRDGLHFRRDPGTRVAIEGASVGSPRVLPLPDGRLRLYFHVYPEPITVSLGRGNHVVSAITEDGIVFRREAGVRIAQTTPGRDDEAVYAASMWRISATRVRTYYSAWNGADRERGVIMAALSDDGGTTFHKHDRACVDGGGPHDGRFASEPDVFRRPDGRFAMVYEACDLEGKTRILAARQGR